MEKTESLYDAATSRVEKLNNLGYDYKGKILKRTLSNYIFADPEREETLSYFENWLYFLVERVKLIRTFYNYTVTKNYRKIN